MGNWYANITMKGPAQAEVLEALREWRRTAFVSAPFRGYTVTYDQECRRMHGDDSERLAKKLTSRFNTTALIALNADDDVLWLCVYRNGDRIVEYESSTPARSGARGIAEALGRTVVTPALWMALQGPFIFEVWRHLAVCRLLGLPGYLCTLGYPGEDDGSLSEYAPEGLFEATRRDAD